MPLGKDLHSYSNFDEVVVRHIYPHLTVDFNRRILFGYTELSLERKVESAPFVRLDIRGLCIEQVLFKNKEPNSVSHLPWTIPKYHATLGSCLEVDISSIKETHFVVQVHYSTSTTLSGGIQWFTPEQTAGKKHPFVYTQFEAILARTMIPCQDTPAVKAPYTISITCPAPLVVACSGAQVGSPTSSGSNLTYIFDQKRAIPSYLIAMTCGAIERRALSANTGVWAELPLLDAAAHEFVDTKQFLEVASEIAGIQYEGLWGHYDLLVLPGAFPYGGMENPSLTFISSSLITGDRALVDVVAHEIAHSWSGNLVSNSNWQDFWLNEGFTMYFERLILGAIHGDKLRHFHALLGYQDLLKTITDMKGEPEFQKLRPNLDNVDPDDAFSRIPYEKGCSLLLHLEQLVGGKDKMITWLRKYFSDFSGASVNVDQMIAHFESFFPNQKVDWNSWLYAPGLPASFDPFSFLDQEFFSKCQELATKWKKGGLDASISDLKWEPSQTMCFIDILINENVPLNKDVLKHMEETYKLSESRNVEILIRWIMLNLHNENIDYIFPLVSDYVSKHGRGVYLRPIYTTLIRLSKEGKIDFEKVKAIYIKNKSFYHSVITNTLSKVFGN